MSCPTTTRSPRTRSCWDGQCSYHGIRRRRFRTYRARALTHCVRAANAGAARNAQLSLWPTRSLIVALADALQASYVPNSVPRLLLKNVGLQINADNCIYVKFNLESELYCCHIRLHGTIPRLCGSLPSSEWTRGYRTPPTNAGDVGINST